VLRNANILAALTTMAMLPMFFYSTLYLQQVLGFGTIRAGFGGLPVAVTIAVSAGLAAALITRLGYRIPLAAGLLVTAAGLGWLSRMSADGSFLADVLGPAIVRGIGGGLAFIAGTVAATAGARPDEAGLASGLFNTSQQVGGAVGIAITVAIATTRTEDALAAGNPLPVALTDGYRSAMAVAAMIALSAAFAHGGPPERPCFSTRPAGPT
jgi:MFS family permease